MIFQHIVYELSRKSRHCIFYRIAPIDSRFRVDALRRGKRKRKIDYLPFFVGGEEVQRGNDVGWVFFERERKTVFLLLG